MPTKEFITYIFNLIVVLIVVREQKYAKFKLILALLVFSYFFRSYYLLVGIVSIAIYYGSKIKFKNKKLLIISIGITTVVFLSLSYGIVKGSYISDSTRELINSRRDAYNNTQIVSPISTDTWYGETVGILYGIYTVNLPLNAFLYLSPHIILFALWQLCLLVYILKIYDSKVKGDNNSEFEWLFYYGIAYFLIQGLFEPDLGSAVRHKAGIFPIIFFMLYYDQFRKKV
ncbi:hypothetical protein ACJRPK_01885 [Aquimarina sp. 2-A2]|uniref:hypothetical protein n=1 Tax=Aquimarina sp. 2-A2 TaxID=3382644 RepID=UPI00387F0C6F